MHDPNPTHRYRRREGLLSLSAHDRRLWWDFTGVISFLMPAENGTPSISTGIAMLQQFTDQTDTHRRIISTLTRLRLEWQEATNGASLLETNGKIGLILADLINGFGLDLNDQCQILGNDLFLELQDFLYTPKHD
jgi:hypothetical protein